MPRVTNFAPPSNCSTPPLAAWHEAGRDEGFDDGGNRAVRVESHGVRQGYAQDAVEAIIRILAVLESRSEVFEVHVVVGKGGKCVRRRARRMARME